METPLPPMNPVVAERRRQAALRRRRRHLRYVRVLWALVALLFIVLMIEVPFTLWHSPRFWIHRIEVQGTETLTEAEVIRLADLPAGTNYFRAPFRKVAERIAAGDPRIAAAEARKGGWGTMVLTVHERQAVYQLAERTPPLYVDAEGILFTRPVPPATPTPLVEGVPLPDGEPPLGTRLSSPESQAALACVAALHEEAGDGTLHVARVAILPPTGATDGNAVKLGLTEGPTVLLGGARDFGAKINMAKNTIQEARARGYALEGLDWVDVSYVTEEMIRDASRAKGSFMPTQRQEAVRP